MARTGARILVTLLCKISINLSSREITETVGTKQACCFEFVTGAEFITIGGCFLGHDLSVVITDAVGAENTHVVSFEFSIFDDILS